MERGWGVHVGAAAGKARAHDVVRVVRVACLTSLPFPSDHCPDPSAPPPPLPPIHLVSGRHTLGPQRRKQLGKCLGVGGGGGGHTGRDNKNATQA